MTDTIETECIGAVHYTELQAGDTITFTAGTHFMVDRPVHPRHRPGTFGSAVVQGSRVHGLIDEDGDFTYLSYDWGYAEKDYTSMFENFEPY